MESIKPSFQQPASGEVKIALPERFTFEHHRGFRRGYIKSEAGSSHYLVDFSKTRSIDSAGLGMLLQLTEFALKERTRVRFVNCSPEVRQTLTLAGLDEQATIA